MRDVAVLGSKQLDSLRMLVFAPLFYYTSYDSQGFGLLLPTLPTPTVPVCAKEQKQARDGEPTVHIDFDKTVIIACRMGQLIFLSRCPIPLRLQSVLGG